MTAAQTQEKHLPVEAFQEMDRRDENQILAEMRGEQLEEFVYSLNLGGREVTNLSYAGVKEAIRRRGQVEILEVRTENDEKEFRALVRVRDHTNKIDVIGAASADRTKPFAWVLAANKAERNAFAKLIPAKWIAILIQEWLERHKKTAGTTVQSQVPQKKETIPEKVEPASKPSTETKIAKSEKWVPHYDKEKLLVHKQSGETVGKMVITEYDDHQEFDIQSTIGLVVDLEKGPFRFLQTCLDRFKEKHPELGFTSRVDVNDHGVLTGISIKTGKLSDKIVDLDIVSPTVWTFNAVMHPEQINQSQKAKQGS